MGQWKVSGVMPFSGEHRPRRGRYPQAAAWLLQGLVIYASSLCRFLFERIVPRSPTVQPCSTSTKRMARSARCVGVEMLGDTQHIQGVPYAPTIRTSTSSAESWIMSIMSVEGFRITENKSCHLRKNHGYYTPRKTTTQTKH